MELMAKKLLVLQIYLNRHKSIHMYLNKAQAKVFFIELDLCLEWKFSTDGYTSGIKSKDGLYTLKCHIEKENNTEVSLVLKIYFPYISYIINKICPEYDYPTNFKEMESFNSSFGSDKELFDFALPIWKEQWAALKPYLHKYETPEKLYQEELESIVNERNPLWYGKSFFGLSYDVKSLILSKLISENVYNRRKYIYNTLTKTPPSSDQSKIRRIEVAKLIASLDDFDAEKYLQEKPWINIDAKAITADPIELERTSILAIQGSLTDQDIAQLCQVDSINKPETFMASASARMSFSDEDTLHVLQLQPSVIAFIQNPIVYERIDLTKVTGEAIKFVIDEDTTDSARIDYYRDGMLMLEFMQSMGEVIEAKQHPDFDLSIDDPLALIESLFERISGRRLASIMGDEEGLIYKLN